MSNHHITEAKRSSKMHEPAHVAHAARNRFVVTSMSKWQIALMGTSGILGILIIAWLVWGGVSYSTATHAVAIERKDAEKSYDNNDQQVIEANSYFIERARAIEAGFKAAFLFHK